MDPSGPSLQQQYYMAHGHPTATFLGAGWAAVLLVCTTLMCLGSAATAFLLVLRPSLRVCVPLAKGFRHLHMFQP